MGSDRSDSGFQARSFVAATVVALAALFLAWVFLQGDEAPQSPTPPETQSASHPVAPIELPGEGAPPELPAGEPCTLVVRVNAASCDEGVDLTLAARDGSWEDGVFLPCEGAPLAKSWTGLSCEGLWEVTAQTEGCADVRRVTGLEPPFTTVELTLNRARTLRIQAIDHSDGTPIEHAWGQWYGNALSTFRVDATTWQGRQGIIEIAVPLAYPLLISASGYAPRTWDGSAGMGPDDYEVLELEPVEVFYVHCTLDGEPCPADDEDLRVISVWHRYLGPRQQEDCEPWSDQGDFLCRGVRHGLEAQAYRDRLVSEPKGQSLPAVFGWDGQAVIGETILEFPLEDPVRLELFGTPEKEPGDPFCVDVASGQPGSCSLRIPSTEAGYGATDWSYTPGETREWPLDLEDRGILECEDGWAVIGRGMARCEGLMLEPWGVVCVDARRFNGCSLLGDLPPEHYAIEGCHDRVRPGRWKAHCRDESSGSLSFIDCGIHTVTAGETTEISCPE